MSNPSNPGSSSSSASAKPSSSQYAVPTIPPFNYAAAAKKSKPSPAVVSGQDATGFVNGSAGASSPTIPAAAAMAAVAGSSQPSSPTSAKKANSGVQVDGVRVPASRVEEIRGAAGSDGASPARPCRASTCHDEALTRRPCSPLAVAFGTAGDTNATLSSSPAAPPSFKNGTPSAFGTLPATTPSAAPATKAPIDLHRLFQGGGSSSGPSPSPAGASGASPLPMERRSVATYDPQARSPGPSTSPLPHHGNGPHLSNPGAPTFVPRGIPPPFVPQQQQNQAFSPPPAGFHMPPPHGYGGPPVYIPQTGPSPQTIPNGGPTGPVPFAPSSAGSRQGSFVGSPVLGGMPPRPPQPQGPRGSFGGPGGPISPRLQNSPLPGGQMMYPGQMYANNVRPLSLIEPLEHVVPAGDVFSLLVQD